MSNKPGSSVISGFTEVTTAGTAVQLVASNQKFPCLEVIVQALGSNEEAVVIGGPEVKATAGAHGSTTRKGIYLEKPGATAYSTVTLEVNDPSQVWVDSLKAKDGVSWIAVLA